jgi:hypothetical protein
MLPLLLLGMAARWAWGRARARQVRRRSDAAADRLVCETYERSLDDTQPIDIVDLDRSSREIHHMTVPELQAVNAEFLALMKTNFPNQT